MQTRVCLWSRWRLWSITSSRQTTATACRALSRPSPLLEGPAQCLTPAPCSRRSAHGIFAHDDHIFVANREAHQVLEFTKEGMCGANTATSNLRLLPRTKPCP